MDPAYSAHRGAGLLPWAGLSYSRHPGLVRLQLSGHTVSIPAIQKQRIGVLMQSRETGSGLVAGACVGILAASVIVFVIVRYLIWLRQWTTEKKLGMKPKTGRSRQHDRDGEEMKDVRSADSPVADA